jgi:uncharacterized cupredoxin-like copper-binding protein
MKTHRALAAILGMSLAVVACSSPAASPTSQPPASEGGAPASAGAGGTPVGVTLKEWSVGSDATSGPAGDFTFTATNEGPEDAHELVVIKTDLALTELPTDDTGAVDEAGEGIEVIDEIEEIEVGSSADLTVTLEPGAYVLICNIYDEAEQEAHYEMGMRAPFTVS